MENDMIAKQNLSANHPRVRDNAAYYQNAIGQLQQQLVTVSQNANQAVAGWRAAERAKTAMQAKAQQLEDEVDKLRRESLAQRKLIEQYKADQDTLVNGQEAYFSIFAKAIADGDEAGVKSLLKSIWIKGGGKPGSKDFDVRIISTPTDQT